MYRVIEQYRLVLFDASATSLGRNSTQTYDQAQLYLGIVKS